MYEPIYKGIAETMKNGTIKNKRLDKNELIENIFKRPGV